MYTLYTELRLYMTIVSMCLRYIPHHQDDDMQIRSNVTLKTGQCGCREHTARPVTNKNIIRIIVIYKVMLYISVFFILL
jgi:hypothetical protein